MFAPEFFQKADVPVKVALIAAFASLATSLLTIAHSLFGAPVKYWLEKRALRNKLATEYEYEQRKGLRTLIGKYQGRMLEAAETLNHRMWNLYANQHENWLYVCGDYKNKNAYYYVTFIYRFLNLLAIARQFEAEAVLIDSRIAEKGDLDFVKFAKAITWAVCDVALFDEIPYDTNFATDHFFRDELRKVCDACMKDGIFLGQEELHCTLHRTSGSHTVFQFFDGLVRGEDRLRWDRLVALHLLVLAFINSFGYDMQKSTKGQFVEVASQVQNPQVLRNLKSWLSRLGLAKQAQAALIANSIELVLNRAPEQGTVKAVAAQ